MKKKLYHLCALPPTRTWRWPTRTWRWWQYELNRSATRHMRIMSYNLHPTNQSKHKAPHQWSVMCTYCTPNITHTLGQVRAKILRLVPYGYSW
jgi:hypothetical protein